MILPAGRYSRLVLVALCLFAARAQAASGWRVCNHTSYVAEVAVGRPSGTDVAVRGWLRLRPGQCRQAVPAPLEQADHYIFARASRAHVGGPRTWEGYKPLCVKTDGAFSLQTATRCNADGYRLQKFQSIAIHHAPGWTTRLLESGDYTLATAQAAGIQRLLNAVGAATTTIDGYIGRRSRAQINAVISDRQLPTRTSDRDLIDVLEAEAIRLTHARGMELCNRTEEHVWTAVAHLMDEQWESRGWWDIDAGLCVRVLDHALDAGPYYVLAEMRNAAGLRRLIGASHTFCISKAKFVISGRRACRERFYDSATFAQTGSATDAHLKVELFDEDFAPAPQDN